jgi:hypothetical protein
VRRRVTLQELFLTLSDLIQRLISQQLEDVREKKVLYICKGMVEGSFRELAPLMSQRHFQAGLIRSVLLRGANRTGKNVVKS